MIALYIICGLVLFFALILLIRVGVRIDYSEDGFFLNLRIACFNIRILPRKKKEAKTTKKKPNDKKKGKGKKKNADKKKAKIEDTAKPKKKLGDYLWLKEFISPGLRALGKLGRKIRFDQISAEYVIGGSNDPCEAAIQYGKVSAGGGALFPLVNSVINVKKWDVKVGIDFSSENALISVLAVATYRIGQLLAIGLAFGFKALLIYLKHRKTTKTEGGKTDGK